MKLSSIKIQNFRGIDSLEISIKNYTTLIGPNNAGKSSILRAIYLLCKTTAPDLEEFKGQDQSKAIVIEGVFDNLDEWEMNQPGISGMVCDGKLHIRMRATVEEKQSKAKVLKVVDYKTRREEVSGFSESFDELSDEVKGLAGTIGFKTKSAYKTKAHQKALLDLIKSTAPELVTIGEYEWTTESKSIDAALQQALPKAILIPAVHHVGDETKITAKSALGELLTALITPRIRLLPEFREIEQKLQDLKGKMHGVDQLPAIRSINEGITKGLKRVVDASSILRLGTPDLESALVSSVELRILDGEADTPVHLQGHGLQRSLIFALLETTAADLDKSKAETDREIQAAQSGSSENQEVPDIHQRSLLLLFEEPELYIHPHLLRKLKDSLRELAGGGLWQVVCTTHSPVFIDVTDDPTSLIILRKVGSSRLVEHTQLLQSPFGEDADGKFNKESLRAALDFNPALNEVFFAQKSILVEGDTELAILKHCKKLLEAVGVDLAAAHDRTVVSCSGKWTIPAIAILLKHFGIPFRVIHDLDASGIDLDKLDELLPFHPYLANSKIAEIVPATDLMVNDNCVEDLIGIGQTKPKPLHAIKKVAKILQDGTLDTFPLLKKLVEFAYEPSNTDNTPVVG